MMTGHKHGPNIAHPVRVVEVFMWVGVKGLILVYREEHVQM